MTVPAGLLYRPMQANDLPQLQQILPKVLPGDWSRETLGNLLHSSHDCRVLEAQQPPGQLAGFAEFLVVLDECQLFNIAITPEFQGKGLGRTLLHLVVGEVQQSGCRTCVLEVRQSNTAAIALYAGQGFTQVGLRKDYYPALQPGLSPENALLFTLAL